MTESKLFKNLKTKLKSKYHLKGGAAPAGQAPGGKPGEPGANGPLAPQANAFNMLPVLFNTFVKILPIGLYAATLIESVLFNDLRGFFIFLGLLLNDCLNIATNYLTTKKDNERCAIVRNMYSEDYFILPTTHTEYISFVLAFLVTSMYFKKTFNHGTFIVFSVILGLTVYNRIAVGCKDFLDAGYSMLMGFFKGIIYYVIVKDFYEPVDVTPKDHWIEKSVKKFLPRSDSDDELYS